MRVFTIIPPAAIADAVYAEIGPALAALRFYSAVPGLYVRDEDGDADAATTAALRAIRAQGLTTERRCGITLTRIPADSVAAGGGVTVTPICVSPALPQEAASAAKDLP